jgi:hypothetical protein
MRIKMKLVQISVQILSMKNIRILLSSFGEDMDTSSPLPVYYDSAFTYRVLLRICWRNMQIQLVISGNTRIHTPFSKHFLFSKL